MKKILLLAALVLAGLCGACQQTRKAAKPAGTIPFVEASNYFFKNNVAMPRQPKIATQQEFEDQYGAATTMGPEGKPTAIDFDRQFVVAIVRPITDKETTITPLRLVEEGDHLTLYYHIEYGKDLGFQIQPCALIVVDKQYEKPKVLLQAE